MGIQSTAEETMNRLFCLFSTLCLISSNAVPQDRAERAFPIFSIVKFANDDCLAAGTVGMTDERRGTCYTAEECTNRDGTAGTSCAEGFGICCQFSLEGATNRGKTVAQNNTRITDEFPQAEMGSVEYTICPCGDNICRIRFNFVSLVLSEKALGTTDSTVANAAADSAIANSIGSCIADTFMVSGTSTGGGSPVICGTNTGHHMVLDSDGKTCHTINMMFGTGTTNRDWELNIIQYACNSDLDNSLAGPPGCLQYHTAQNGRVSDYGYAALPATGATPTLDASTTHLANQDYNICFRRFAAQCRICFANFAPTGGVGTDAAIDQAGFGVGNGPTANAAANQATEGECDTDFISIPGAQEMAQTGTTGVVTRLCGRRLNNAAIDATASVTICTRITPFMIGVNFGEGEEITAGTTMADTHEGFVPPSGHVGFRLDYKQVATGC